ncbi:MAG: Wzz/FepE/Etk N-terminal domain-containing protein [Acidobacteriota bacterium]|nr:Wzz/FepE/Etk N-terminal domain-containing protein [Acidobacteriota bacterium]
MTDRPNESSLIDYLDILWKRKWLIIVPTILFVGAVSVISYTSPKIWEVDMIIQPSNLFVQTEQGEFAEIVVIDPRQVAGQINQRSYDNELAAELNMDIREFPRLHAETLRDTKLIRVFERGADREKAKTILLSLFNHLKTDFDKRIEVEIKSIDTQVENKRSSIVQNRIDMKDNENKIALKRLQISDKGNEITTKQNEIKKKANDIKFQELDVESKGIEKEKIRKEIDSLKVKFTISEERVKNILEEMKSVKSRIDALEAQLEKALASQKQGSEALSLLLYSNEVQQSLRYYNTLDEKLSIEKIAQENTRMEILAKEQDLRKLDTEINQIRTKCSSLQADIEDIQTEIKVVKTEIEKIHKEIELINNNTERIMSFISTFESEISLLKDKKGRLDYAKLIKEPTSSVFPVAPNKKHNILMALFFSLVFTLFLAFFLEYVSREKSKRSRSSASP